MSQPVSDPNIHEPTVGKLLLKSRGFFTVNYWYWICIGALIGFTILFNILFIAAIQFLNRKSSSHFSSGFLLTHTYTYMEKSFNADKHSFLFFWEQSTLII